MDPLQSLHITDLLREREAEFVRVWESEQAIQTILGGAFRFAPPPNLPSRAKPRRSRTAAAAPARLRRLRADQEQAYQVEYECAGATRTSLTTNGDFLRSLLELDPPGFRVRRVESVRLDPAGIAHAVSLLWQREPDSGA